MAENHFAFLAISDQYAILFVLILFSQNGHRRLFWITENHFQSLSNFSPFQINTQVLFFLLHKMAAILDDWKSLLSISRHFRSIRNLFYFKFVS